MGRESKEPAQRSMLAEAGAGRIKADEADVGATRERRRQRALLRLTIILLIPTIWLWHRVLTGNARIGLPTIDPFLLVPISMMLLIVGVLIAMTVGAGRSPHVTYRPEQITVGLDDVKGVETVKEDVVRSLNLFLAHKTFTTEMGGTPRRGLLFEGDPGTGKTMMAKALAREAGVPFLFVSATSFQSMYYGATARKIRSYFKAVRKAARAEGGAIAFIEEIDAIATSRSGLGMSPAPAQALDPLGFSCAWAPLTPAPAGTVTNAAISEGTGGVVNELLVQLQSFDEPTGLQKLRTWLTDKLNGLLPMHRQIQRPTPPVTNILVIAATNRADSLDPALLRPGRFDRRLTFARPGRSERRELVDHFLSRKSHGAELDTDEARENLSAITQGYTPVMIEHLMDEALVNALRRGDTAMSTDDVHHARLTEEIGIGQPVQYTDREERLIATHEAGHATVAWLVAPERRLEVLTLIKRRDALGLLAHGDRDEVFTRSKTEMLHLIQIAMGGQVAEELFFGDISTGPSGDLLSATQVAAQMVGLCGMDETLISFGAIAGGFADTNIVGRVLGDSQGRESVERLLQDQRDFVRGLLVRNRHLVAALRDALVERHELVGAEITNVLEQADEVPAAS